MSGAAATGHEPAAEPAGAHAAGVLPAQRLREAIAAEWMVADPWSIPRSSVQPASVDLRLGEHAWALRCSFLPGSDSTVERSDDECGFLPPSRIASGDGRTPREQGVLSHVQ